MTHSAASLWAAAAGLRSLNATFLACRDQIVTMASATGELTAVDGSWTGPRAQATLDAAHEYTGAVFGLPPRLGAQHAIDDVREVISAWATTADDLAGRLSTAAGTISASGSMTTITDEMRVAAETEIRNASDEWDATCRTTALTLDGYSYTLAGTGMTAPFASDFPYSVTTGMAYAQAVYQFALTAPMPLNFIDPSGQLAAMSRAQLDWLFETEQGSLVFTIIETAHEADVGEADEHWSYDDLFAASDPELVERHIREIYAELGEPITDDQVGILVEQTVSTSLAIRASGSEEWQDRDEDLGFFEHGLGEWLREDFAGPAAAFVAMATCEAVVTTTTGGTLSAPAAGACAAGAGMVGDFVGSMANGEGFVDSLQAAADPTHIAFNFTVGAATQGTLNWGTTQLEGAARRWAAEAITESTPVGSALKADAFHRAGAFVVDDIAEHGTFFRSLSDDGVERTLVQMPGEVNGIPGRFEWILDGADLTHQRFIPGGEINGVANVP